MTNLLQLPLRDFLTLSSLRGQAGNKCLFDKSAQTGQDKSNDSWLEEKIKDGIDKSLPLDQNQMREAIKLIKTGEAAEDIKFSLIETLTTIGPVSTDLLSDPFSLFTSPLDTIESPITAARDSAKIFVDPDNRTFRLAILGYARMNGINITERNIDDVYNILDDPNSESLEALAKGGLETIKAEYGLNDLNEARQKFESLTN